MGYKDFAEFEKRNQFALKVEAYGKARLSAESNINQDDIEWWYKVTQRMWDLVEKPMTRKQKKLFHVWKKAKTLDNFAKFRAEF